MISSPAPLECLVPQRRCCRCLCWLPVRVVVLRPVVREPTQVASVSVHNEDLKRLARAETTAPKGDLLPVRRVHGVPIKVHVFGEGVRPRETAVVSTPPIHHVDRAVLLQA